MAKRKDILDEGTRTHGPYFTLRHTNKGSGTPKVSFIIGSKLLKKAVDRNKFKRTLRGFVQDFKKDIKDKTEAVVFLKKPALDLDKKNLRIEIMKIFRKAKLIK